LRNEAAKIVFIEVVWSALSEDQWLSASELKAASGADDNTLARIVDFLVRWNFAEIRHSPSLHVKRRSGAISPTDVVGLLRAVNESKEAPVIPKRGVRLAERVACRSCGGRGFRVVGENDVECTNCQERQWYAIEIPGSRQLPFRTRGNMFKRLIMRLNIAHRA
jgi:hypothetical protein